MRRVISTGGLLMALSTAAWGASGCFDNGGDLDGGSNVIENAAPPIDAEVPDADRPWVNDNVFPPEIDADTTDAAADAAAEDASQP